MKTIRLLLITSLMLLGVNSCKQAYEIDLPATVPLTGVAEKLVINTPPIISDKAVIITALASGNIKELTETKIVLSSLVGVRAIGGESRGGRLASLDVQSIKVGDIIVSGPTEKAPSGFLGRVTGVIQEGTDWVIDYTESALDELFGEVAFTYDFPLSIPLSIDDLTLKLGIAKTTFTGSWVRSYDSQISLLIHKYKLEKMAFNTTETQSTRLQAVIRLDTKQVLKYSKRVAIGTKTFRKLLLIGPAPVVINVTFEIYARFDAALNAIVIETELINYERQRTLKFSYTPQTGSQYDSATIYERDKPLSVTRIEAEGELQMSVGLDLVLSFYLQNFFRKDENEPYQGFVAENEVYSKLVANCSTDKGLKVALREGARGSGQIRFKWLKVDKTYPYQLYETPVFNGVFNVGFCKTDSVPTPVDNNTARTPTAVSTSDPHMKTFDQVAYDFMAAGEFVAAKSGTDRFEIQVRQQEIKRSNASGQVSFNTGLAMHTGSDAICIYPDGRLFINQARVSLTSAGYPLRGGWAIQQTSQGMNVISTGGDQVEIRLFGTNLDYYTSLATTRKSTLKGLLGNFDGIATNDLVRGDNGQAVQNTFATLYPAFADSWRIKQAESLFVYDAGTNTDTYTDKAFPRQAISLTAQQRANAETVCKNQGITDPVALQNCIVDVGLTGDNTLASRSLDFQTAGNVLNSFAIGQFLTTDVQLAYTSATAENSAAVLNSAGSGFSRVVMQQGVNIRNGFVSEFSFTAEEFNPASCFFLAIWPTTPNTRNLYQTRAGFCFGISNGVPITFFDIDQANVPGLPAKANITPFNDKQVHRVRISEKRLSNGKFRVEIFYDNLVSPVVSIDNEESIAQIIDAPQNTGYIEFQINTGSPTKVKVFNWTYQAQ